MLAAPVHTVLIFGWYWVAMDGLHTIAGSARRKMKSRGGPHSRAVAPKGWRSRHSKWALALVGALVVAVGVIIAFYTAPKPPPVHPAASAPPLQATRDSSAPSRAANPPATPQSPEGLAADFAQLQTRLHAKTGLIVSGVGAQSRAPVTLGNWSSGPAWSTIKVPLVIAAMRQANTDQVTKPMTAAITDSDNAAAESIWEGLGDPPTAAAKVEAVLRDTGDPTTVQSQKVRPEFTAFGQTDWSLSSQALFLSAAACDPREKPVLALMGQVNNDQKWGLGVIPATKIKGGWGPSLAGRYLVRQIGILPTEEGLTVVAMAAEPESGLFADGTQDLTELANWLHTHLGALPTGQCTS